jgi:hypothetical protein
VLGCDWLDCRYSGGLGGRFVGHVDISFRVICYQIM